MRIYQIIIVIFPLLACKARHCPVNDIVVEKFRNNLALIKSAEENNLFVSTDEYRNSLIFLTSVTGIMTKADYSSTMGYTSKEDYIRDMKLWSEWLKKNKCKLTVRYVDSCMADVQ
jgi:hypothetical protein